MANKTIPIENAVIKFRDFQGLGDKYHQKGNRHFSLVLAGSDEAAAMKAEGWNVKCKLFEDDPGREPEYTIEVKVSYEKYPPAVWLVSSSGAPVLLNETTIGQLDATDLQTVDLIIEASPWSMNGKSGLKAYLKEGYFVVQESPFRKKYSSYFERSLRPEEPEDDDDI